MFKGRNLTSIVAERPAPAAADAAAGVLAGHRAAISFMRRSVAAAAKCRWRLVSTLTTLRQRCQTIRYSTVPCNNSFCPASPPVRLQLCAAGCGGASRLTVTTAYYFTLQHYEILQRVKYLKHLVLHYIARSTTAASLCTRCRTRWCWRTPARRRSTRTAVAGCSTR